MAKRFPNRFPRKNTLGNCLGLNYPLRCAACRGARKPTMSPTGDDMTPFKAYARRLFPAALQTAACAAVLHTTLVAIFARHIGLESLHIAAISFLFVLALALPGGAVLLLTVWALRLGRTAALILFLVTIEALAIALEMYGFDIGLEDVSWQYGLITLPSAVVAWHGSVYQVAKHAGAKG